MHACTYTHHIRAGMHGCYRPSGCYLQDAKGSFINVDGTPAIPNPKTGVLKKSIRPMSGALAVKEGCPDSVYTNDGVLLADKLFTPAANYLTRSVRIKTSINNPLLTFRAVNLLSLSPSLPLFLSLLLSGYSSSDASEGSHRKGKCFPTKQVRGTTLSMRRPRCSDAYFCNVCSGATLSFNILLTIFLPLLPPSLPPARPSAPLAPSYADGHGLRTLFMQAQQEDSAAVVHLNLGLCLPRV